MPIDLPDPGEGPIANAFPEDVVGAQLRGWMEGRTSLDHGSRLAHWRERACRVELRRIHHQEQQEAAAAELADIGELALQEADAGPVIALHERVEEGDWLLGQCDQAQALIERRLNRLAQGKRPYVWANGWNSDLVRALTPGSWPRWRWVVPAHRR
ncbi:hypothetical protein [Brevibacterium renqingii]|uniref:hypothetical protein n=1 Tax=Brevibacterium renqingii TaxID=2776916 RepID=UPI001ADEF9E5|nr:hypothetical protein [Brevibacterium renqingii]